MNLTKGGGSSKVFKSALKASQNEFDERRRLLQGLQERVEGVPRDLVDFIDDVDLEAARGGLVARILNELADLVDPAVGSAVDLLNV
ncbi:MAG: hypothetical protein HYT78_13990 [Deltaproteobacteria bacterium]|nr:hypothetical protein [Deltaproteobacteria bacterium]